MSPRHRPNSNGGKNNGEDRKQNNITKQIPAQSVPSSIPPAAEPMSVRPMPSAQQQVCAPFSCPTGPQRHMFQLPPPMFYDPYSTNRFSPLMWHTGACA